MTLEETIKYHKEIAEEFRQEAEQVRDLGEYISSPKQPYNEPVKYYYECTKEHEQHAEWLEELVELRKFTKFVTSEVVCDMFEDNSGSFAEIACRKLVKLGYVEVKGDTYWDIVNVKKIDENNSRKRSEEVRSPIGHKHEIIRMLRKDTECPYSACVKAYEKALEYLRCGGDV